MINILVVGVREKEAKQAFKEIEDDFMYWNRVWNPWGKSAMSRMNSLFQSTEWVSAAPSVRPVIKRAKELSIKSNGLFNPSIGKLIKLWGFDSQPGKDLPPKDARPPDAERINLLVRSDPKMTDIVFDDIKIKSKNKDVMVDLGGVAKGYAMNHAIKVLKRRGIKNAIVNGGGDLKGMGTRITRPWRIAIVDPFDKKDAIGSIYIEKEESIFTSGDYERFFVHNNVRYHHILDPRTGYPARGVRSVTVIHEDGTLADAAATAIFIAGPKQWVQVAKNMGVNKVMLIDDKGNIFVSLEMFNRLQLHLRKDTTLRVIPFKPVIHK
jgi:thiamine biosynthesis lipoprotein